MCSEITNFDEFGKPADFDEVQKRGNFYTAAMCFYSLVGTGAYAIKAALEIPQCK